MIGLAVMAVGWLCVLVGLVVVLGLWALIPVGVVTLTAGLWFDWEAPRGKRS